MQQSVGAKPGAHRSKALVTAIEVQDWEALARTFRHGNPFVLISPVEAV